MQVLFAPLAGLEVQRLVVSGAVLEAKVSLSINLASATLEQVRARNRKVVHDIKENAELDLRAGLGELISEDRTFADAVERSGCLAQVISLHHRRVLIAGSPLPTPSHSTSPS